jgi:large subunit ribosomal protein L18
MNSRTQQLHKRRIRIRAKLHGTAIRPRLAVVRSNQKISIQLVDDTVGSTITTVVGDGKNTKAAQTLGLKLAEWATQHNIKSIIFDRSGYLYHGSIKTLCDAIREGGIQV